MKSNELRPTVWRTARALLNEGRLRLMRAIWFSKGRKTVSELAKEVGLSVSTTSTYLRALNARGLISVNRIGPYVRYSNGKDRSLPEAQAIQAALGRMFSRAALPEDWIRVLMQKLRAYSHPRRIAIMQCIAKKSGMGFVEISKLTGIPQMSLFRHMCILRDSGLIAEIKNEYSLAVSDNDVESTLRNIAIPSLSQSLSHFEKCDSGRVSQKGRHRK